MEVIRILQQYLASRGLFYGWVIVGVGFLIAFSSGPGQSYVFSVFLDSIIKDTGLSRTAVSALYAVGTGVSAVMVAIVSRLADRFGPRQVVMFVAVGMACACFSMALASGFVAFFFAFAALRALGQGSTPINATLMTAQWFVDKRGRAMAVMGMGFAASLAILPPVSRLLIDSVGWREAYALLGVMVLLLVIPPTFLFARDTPEKMDLHPDGYNHPPESEVGAPKQGEPDNRRVLTSWTFWILAIALTTSPFVSTALVFHQTGIFEERGVGAGIAAAVFVPFALANAISSAASGVVVDRTGPKPVFVVAMMLLLVGLALSRLVNGEVSAVVYATMLGTAGGLQRIVSSVIWAHYYGRHGLGRIQGSATSIMITMSALGPLPLAMTEAASGTYTLGIVLMAAMPVLSIIGVLVARTARQHGQPVPVVARSP